jgi:hypothetical protein
MWLVLVFLHSNKGPHQHTVQMHQQSTTSHSSNTKQGIYASLIIFAEEKSHKTKEGRHTIHFCSNTLPPTLQMHQQPINQYQS